MNSSTVCMYSLDVCIANYKNNITIHGYPYIPDDPNELALKNKVMKYIRLELLDMDMLVPLLNKYQLLTQANMYDLKNPLVAPTERANLLVYHILPSKGPGTFTLFVKCLQEEKEHLGHQTLTQLFSSPLHCENTGQLTICHAYKVVAYAH